jgi:hypothetical protein
MMRAAACLFLPFPRSIERYQDAEKASQRRSRIVQTLNVPQRVRLEPSLAAALLDSLFEHPGESGKSVGQAGNMHLELAPGHIVDIAAQGILHHGKGNLVPGNLRE